MAIIEADGGDPLEMFQNALFQTVNEDQWVTYKDYLQLMLEGWKKFKDMDLKRPQLKGVFLKNMSKRALKNANKKAKFFGKLQHLWNRLGFDREIGAYVDFEDDPDADHLY